MSKKDIKSNIEERYPVVVIMGHIDHGKSTLLDYIRKTNIVEKEAGGITQHISAYEVPHKNEKGQDMKITFLDTPGHEAFSKMRERGASVADIAILIVSAEDGVKAQTIEALNSIKESKIPYIVAINKIDKPGANPEKTKMDLLEHEVYLEGYGGQIPYVEISAKAGTGVDNLLTLILLVAELGEFKADKSLPATGVVIESKLDSKRGITATLIIKDGTLSSGMFVVAGDSISTTRIFEDFLGKPIKEASFSSPIRITGFDDLPAVGAIFKSFKNKKDAEAEVVKNKIIKNDLENKKINPRLVDQSIKFIPLIIKADVLGSIEAIEKEIEKLRLPDIIVKVIQKGVGNIGESDIKIAASNPDTLIVGFNTKVDKSAMDLDEKDKVSIHLFDTIYKLTDFLNILIEEKRPRKEVVEITGKAKIQRTFSKTKDKQVAGGKVLEGRLLLGSNVRILRRDFEIGQGKIVDLEQSKIKTKEVVEGNEFGTMINSKIEISPGDIIESFNIVYK